MKAQSKKSVSESSSTGPLKATHAPTPSKRWRAQHSDEERKER